MAQVMIPGGLQTNPHFFAIKGFLHSLLNELVASGTGAKRVVSRLNDSSKATPDPVFVGVVEDEDVTQRRRPHPHHGDVGIERFKDTNPSIVYAATLKDPDGEIQMRNWNSQAHRKEKDDNDAEGRHPKSRGPGAPANCKFQRFIAIRIPIAANKNQHVGTITVGFANDPTQQETKIKQIMQKWAQQPNNSVYIKYLMDNFRLNGPTFP